MTFELSATMDAGSRFYDYFSEAFAEVGAAWPDDQSPQLSCSGDPGLPCDGFFSITALPAMVDIATGDRIFTRGRELALGQITVDDSTLLGSGLETAAVTAFGVGADIAADVAGDDLVGENLGPYSTTVPPGSVTGSASFQDGVLVGVTLTADVLFDVPVPAFPPTVRFEGSFSLVGNRFELLAGPDVPTLGAPELGWELRGVIDQVLPGDYDDDGVVDGDDYTEWTAEFGRSVTPWTSADGNGDGLIDGADYTVWRDNHGLMVVGPPSAAVPEPSGLLVAASLAVAWAGRVGPPGGRVR